MQWNIFLLVLTRSRRYKVSLVYHWKNRENYKEEWTTFLNYIFTSDLL